MTKRSFRIRISCSWSRSEGAAISAFSNAAPSSPVPKHALSIASSTSAYGPATSSLFVSESHVQYHWLLSSLTNVLMKLQAFDAEFSCSWTHSRA